MDRQRLCLLLNVAFLVSNFAVLCSILNLSLFESTGEGFTPADAEYAAVAFSEVEPSPSNISYAVRGSNCFENGAGDGVAYGNIAQLSTFPGPATSSWHDCLESTCLLRNVCMDKEGGARFMYFAAHDDLFGDPLKHGMRYNYEKSKGPIDWLGQHLFAPLKVVRGTIPVGYSMAEGEGVHIIMRRYVASNVGHVLGDEVVAAFRLLEAWSLLSMPIFVYLLKYSKNSFPFQLLTDQQPMKWSNQSMPPGRCYGRVLLADWTTFNFMKVDQPPPLPQTHLLRFRDFVWHRFGVGTPTRPHQPVVLILEKVAKQAWHKCLLDGVPELAAHLAIATGVRIARASWAGMALPDQVRLMARTDVVISLPGSDLMNCVFLPTKAGIIVPARTVAKLEYSNEVRLWFKYMPYKRIITYNPYTDGESTSFEKKGAKYIRLGKARLTTYLKDILRHLCRHGELTSDYC